MNKLTIFLFLLFSSAAEAQQLPWIPFNWEGGTLAGRRFDKVAITVPVALDNLPHKFKMQLDLGATTTVVYANPLAPYLPKYPALTAKLDTTRTFYIQSQKNPKLVGVKLKLGAVDFGLRDLGYFRNFGDKLTAKTLTDKTEVHVGTIAPDLFQNRVLIIDYPHQRLCVVDQVPAAYAKASFQPFKLKDGRIKIPLRINGQPEDLLFDTGSSLFALLTTRQRATAAATEAVQDSIKTSSWGEYYYVYGRRPKQAIYFGTKQLSDALMFSDNIQKFNKLYQEENVWGITGNAYFLHNTVIIDYKNHVFGVQ
ncbi:hypothetical protein FNT36_00250 [Hymenobacter setariae]|uniref:Aspartyl protease n=1 Tax=Hymenobacter setariae TaxID=2594794 RepID=A0A558C1B8_9BACT|nr:hypothetical protein [Hymenobacter setariae]TVT42569.1 hypothetical protein FNT36_00250 [Hymenobacter setariae]